MQARPSQFKKDLDELKVDGYSQHIGVVVGR